MPLVKFHHNLELAGPLLLGILETIVQAASKACSRPVGRILAEMSRVDLLMGGTGAPAALVEFWSVAEISAEGREDFARACRDTLFESGIPPDRVLVRTSPLPRDEAWSFPPSPDTPPSP